MPTYFKLHICLSICLFVQLFAYMFICGFYNQLQFLQSYHNMYSRDKKGTHPYYISPIEIGLLWAKITYLKTHSSTLGFELKTDTK